MDNKDDVARNTNEPDTAQSGDPVVSETGVHWHTDLAVIINGQTQVIPPNLSGDYLGTQDSSGKVHWGPSGRVTESQLRLTVFFQTWGQPFSPSQILDKQNSSEGIVKMTVNGQPNTEFENYSIKDGDKIEIRYE